jgi:hypothetical protein
VKIEVDTCGHCPLYDEDRECCCHPSVLGAPFRGCDGDVCPDFCPLRKEDMTITFGVIESMGES